jgi:hypothetical protein
MKPKYDLLDIVEIEVKTMSGDGFGFVNKVPARIISIFAEKNDASAPVIAYGVTKIDGVHWTPYRLITPARTVYECDISRLID